MKEKREWLTGIRVQLKMTHQDVADSAEIDRSFYTQIENGDRNPSVETAQKIANALKFDWTIFFAQGGGMKPQKKPA